MAPDSEFRPIPTLTLGECLSWFTVAIATTQLPLLVVPATLAILARLLSAGAPGALMIFLGAQPIVATIELSLVPLPSTLLATSSLSTAVLFVVLVRRPRADISLLWLLLWSLLVVGLAWLRMTSDPDGILAQRLTLLAIQLGAGALIVSHFHTHQIEPHQLLLAGTLVAAGALVHAAALDIPLFTRPGHAPLQDIGRCACVGAVAIGAVTAFRWRGGSTWLLVVLTLLACLAGMSTLSRQGIWSFLLAMVVMTPLALRGRPSATLRQLALFPLVPVALLAVLGIWASLDGEMQQRLLGLRFTQNPVNAFDTRIEVYRIAWQMFTSRPLFGWGFGGFGHQVGDLTLYPHNVALEILSEFGIVGLLVWLIPLVSQLAGKARGLSAGDPRDVALHRGAILALVIYWFGISSSSYSLPHSGFLFAALLWIPTSWRGPIQSGKPTEAGANDA